MAKVGFRFYPTDEELMNYYLMNQILGNTKQVEETISEINFYDYDPVSLPPLSRNQSDNGIYYFFALKQYTNSSKRLRKRSSEYGIWKLTGDVTEIKDKISGETIGDKKVLVYQKRGASKARGIKSSWVMHEYQISHSQYQDSYVICKLFDKREEEEEEEEDAHISYGNNSSEPTYHPQVFDSKISPSPKVKFQVEQPGQELDIDQNNNNILNVQLQTPYLSQPDDEFLAGLKHVDREQVEHLFYEHSLCYGFDQNMQLHELMNELEGLISVQEFRMQENRNDLRMQKRPLSEVSRDTEGYAESISAMSYKGTWSSSVGSSNNHFPRFSSTDLQSFEDLFQSLERLTQSKKVRL